MARLAAGVRGRAALAMVTMMVGLGAAAAAPAAEDNGGAGVLGHGGRLYADWPLEARESDPVTPHPGYPSGLGAATAGDTWRCVNCHGWDYRGARDAGGRRLVKGIDGMAGATPEAVMAVLTDDGHRYDRVLGREALEALAAFVARGQGDTARFVDEGGRARGAGGDSEALYQTVCANCHGYDGLALHTMPPLGDVARDAPWRTLHNMLNGHAGAPMPALRVLPEDQVAGLLGYLQALPTVEPLLSLVRGGRLYDNWVKELGALAPTRAHPAYPLDGRFADEPARTWRCKECHGWDYKGRDGQYADGRHATGIKGIRGMAGAEAAAVVEVLTDATHRYDRVLPYQDLLDLANFVGRGQVDMDAFIDAASGAALRPATAKATSYYGAMCANCHGAKGDRAVGVPPLGDIAAVSPWNALHTILNGHPSADMPALRGLGEDLAGELLAYLQTLPRR